MKRLISFLFLITIASANECDKLGTLLYEDLGCTPQIKPDSACPYNYTCNGLEKWQNECHFRGKVYKIGESVANNLSSPSCDKACRCDDKGKFNCAILDCPEWLGVHPKFGCYFKYSLEECCTVGEICKNKRKTEIAKCVVGDQTYSEGQKFQPDNTCLTCVCQKNFTGELVEPFCRRVTCGEQLKSSAEEIQKGCAPLHYSGEVLCCPRFWICPKDDDEIKGKLKKSASDDLVCKFGDKSLKLGQFIEQQNVDNPYGDKIAKVRCDCVIPPLLTCKEIK